MVGRLNLEKLDTRLIKNFEERNLSKHSLGWISDYRLTAINLVKEVMYQGGLAPNGMNYINDKLVNLFLLNRIGFLDIVNYNIATLEKFFSKNSNIEKPSIDDIINFNKWIDSNIYLGE